MKKKLKFGLLLLGVMALGIYFAVENKKQTGFADLAFNVDALAGGEDHEVGRECLEDGSVDCQGIKVKYMIELRSLKK